MLSIFACIVVKRLMYWSLVDVTMGIYTGFLATEGLAEEGSLLCLVSSVPKEFPNEDLALSEKQSCLQIGSRFFLPRLWFLLVPDVPL